MRTAARGQAAIELLAMVPLIVLVGLLGWQLMAVVAAGLSAEDAARTGALRATGASGGVVTVTAEVAVPVVIPGVRGLRVPARAAVRTP